MYKIFLTARFLKQLDKKIKEYVSPQLQQEPHFEKNIKKLRDYLPERWRYRIGRFRLFHIVDETDRVVALILR